MNGFVGFMNWGFKEKEEPYINSKRKWSWIQIIIILRRAIYLLYFVSIALMLILYCILDFKEGK